MKKYKIKNLVEKRNILEEEMHDLSYSGASISEETHPEEWETITEKIKELYDEIERIDSEIRNLTGKEWYELVE